MQGSPLFDQYVTSYEVLYGDDGKVFSTVNGPDGEPKVSFDSNCLFLVWVVDACYTNIYDNILEGLYIDKNCLIAFKMPEQHTFWFSKIVFSTKEN